MALLHWKNMPIEKGGITQTESMFVRKVRNIILIKHTLLKQSCLARLNPVKF